MPAIQVCVSVLCFTKDLHFKGSSSGVPSYDGDVTENSVSSSAHHLSLCISVVMPFSKYQDITASRYVPDPSEFSCILSVEALI